MATDFSEEISPVKNLVNLLKLPKGSVMIKSNGQPELSLQFKGDNVLLDIIDASFSILQMTLTILDYFPS